MTDPPGKILPPKAPQRPQINPIMKPTTPQVERHSPVAEVVLPRPTWHRKNRVRTLDGKTVNLIGFYEAVPSNATMNSGFTMQVNQAGLTLVGWISEVPEVVLNVTPIKTLPSLPKNQRIGFIVFYASLDSAFLGRSQAGECLIQFYWVARKHSQDQPSDEKINLFDPNTWGGGTTGPLQLGTLRLEYQPEPDYGNLGVNAKKLALIENKSWQITGIHFAGSQTGSFDPVRLVRRKVRLPYDIIRQIGLLPSSPPQADTKPKEDILRSALIASHVCIIPESHLLKILRLVTKLYIYGPDGPEDDEPPASESALDEWFRADNKFARRIARENVIKVLIGFSEQIARLPYPYHREIVRDLFIFNARITYKEGQTYYDLYVEILDEEYRDHPNSAENLLEPILRWGIFPGVTVGQSFLYTITLSPVGAVSAILALLRPLPVKGGAATVDIKCEQVEFELDDKGKKKLEPISGNPVVKRVIRIVYDTLNQSNPVSLVAITGTFGIAPTTMPAAVKLFSHIRDLKYEDFTDADFRFVWIQGTPKIKIGPYAEIPSLVTGYFNITLPRRHNIELWGSVTQLPRLDVTISASGKKVVEAVTTPPKSWQDLLKKGEVVKPYVEDIYTKGPEAAAEGWLDSLRLKNIKAQFKELISITVGTGIMKDPQPIRTPNVNVFTLPKPTVEDTHYRADLRIHSFFEQNSAELSDIVQSLEHDNIVHLRDAREMIESFLAVNLAVIMDTESKIDIIGHASPEGPLGPLPAGQYDPYNDKLSEYRADAVYYAIIDAMLMFPSNAWAAMELTWKGESVARTPISQGGGGLSDPPATSNTQAFLQWLKTHRYEVEQWPDWRSVDVYISGFTRLRLYD